MDKVASNLMNSVIEFFGILLPGVIFVFLHYTLLFTAFTSVTGTKQAQMQTDWFWVPAFIVSLITGHFLHAFSDFLDDYANRFYIFPKKTKPYFDAVQPSITLTFPKDAEKTLKNYFYFAFSFLRINHAGAVAELERQAADFKFFRSLTLLFLVEIVLSFIDPNVIWNVWPRGWLVSLLIACLSAITYKLLLEWAYQLAFELYIQIQESKKQNTAKCEV